MRWSDGYALVSLNSLVRIHVAYVVDESMVTVWLVKRNTPIKVCPLEVIWECELANPRCFDKLRDFIHNLPDKLAQVDPSYAVIP